MTKPIHILLVEDNDGDILLTVEALREGSIFSRISVVKDGWEAIQFIENSGLYKDEPEPDLVLLDVNLPKMNGHEVLAKIKQNELKKHIPVVVLTTSSTASDVLKCYQNHANCYITKPVDADDYTRVISAIEDFWFSIVKLPKN